MTLTTCSVIVCVSGRLELFCNHLDMLAKAPRAGEIEYCLATWGDDSEHLEALYGYEDTFGLVKYVSVSDTPYFPLPQAYNAALSMATSGRVVVLGSEVMVVNDPVDWVDTLDLNNTAVLSACINTGDKRWLIGPEHHGAFPYCMAINRQALLAIGGWDEEFSKGVVFDDTDLGLRLIASGIDFMWDYSYEVLHQSHERTHGADRGKHAARNKSLVEARLNGFPMNDIWPCWWRELYTGKPKAMPEGDGLQVQAALRDELRRRSYPIESHSHWLRGDAGCAAVRPA